MNAREQSSKTKRLQAHQHLLKFVALPYLSMPPVGQLSCGDHFWWETTYVVVERVAVKVPRIEQLDPLALALGPHVAICEGSIEHEHSSRDDEEANRRGLVDDRILADDGNRDTSRQEVEELAQRDNGKNQGWEVVMQEELALHQIEGEVVESPTQHRRSDLKIESFESCVGVVVAASLPPQDGDALEKGIDGNGQCRAPPNNRIAHEVHLAVVLAPEVDTALQNRPGRRPRIPGVRLHESGVRLPHDLLKLPELAKEARVVIIDLLGRLAQERVLVILNVPQAIRKSTTTSAGNFLLF